MTETAQPVDELKIPAYLRRKTLTRKAKRTTAFERRLQTVKKRAAAAKKAGQPPRAQRTSALSKTKPIGIVTHFYDQISVAVIKLSAQLREGDAIRIAGEKGPFEQTVNSMQHNRKPIKRATKGKDIGLKVMRKPKLGEIVYKIS